MLKKSLIFVSAALFLVALITLTGCPTSADDGGSSGTVYAHRIYGTAVDPYTAQEVINRAVAAGEPVVLEDGLSIGSIAGSVTGQLNFKGAQVRINGQVSFNDGVMNMVDAVVEWADGASLISIRAYIQRKGLHPTGVDRAAYVEYVDRFEDIMPTATAAAVSRFKLGTIQDYDYSTDPNGSNPRVLANIDRIYVLDELVLPTGAGAPSADFITALGSVDIIGTNTQLTVGPDGSGASIILGTSSTLTASQGNVTVYAVGPTELPNVEVQEGKPFTIAQAAPGGALEIPGKLTGKGTLVISTAPDEVTIAGGDGNIRFPAVINTTTHGINIGSTGLTTFESTLTLGAASTIAGDVEFNGAVSAAGLTLLGNVTLVSGAAPRGITFTTAAPLILGANKTVSLRITPLNQTAVTVRAPILEAGPSGVVLTPTATGTLVAAAVGNKTDEASLSTYKKITLGTVGMTITDGTLRVAPGAAFELAAALTTSLDTSTPLIGHLAVADTGTLSFTSGGSVDIGDTVISSAAASTLKAEGGIVTLGENKILGGAEGATLRAATNGTNPVITLDPSTPPGGKVLMLEQVNLHLVNGQLLIKGVAATATANQVELSKLAKITLNATEGGKAATLRKIGANNAAAVLDGDFEGITAPNATATNQTAWSVAHKGGSNVTITGISAVTAVDVKLARSGTAFVQ